MTRQPDQPVEFADRGVIRFKANPIVEYLLEEGDIDLNDIAIEFASDEFRDDRRQFAQLIGYSVSGWGTLHYVSEKAWRRVDKKVRRLRKKRNNDT